jgi:hypothetical protein
MDFRLTPEGKLYVLEAGTLTWLSARTRSRTMPA